MNKKSKSTAKFLAVVLAALIAIPSVAIAFATIEWPDDLVGFEKSDPVYSSYEDLGTALEDIDLPESIRGIVVIPEEMEGYTLVQSVPGTGDSDSYSSYDYYDYGYVAPTDAETSYAAEDLVIYTVYLADESGNVEEIQYRIYGYLKGDENQSAEVWFTFDAEEYLADDAEGNIEDYITGAVLDIPVTWEDTDNYDCDTEGEYTFTAQISEESSYTYSGDMPTASITVHDEDAVDYSVSSMISTYSASTMSLGTTYYVGADNKYYDGNGNAAIMADLISDYVTTNISTSGNESTSQASGDWIDYLNTVWYNIVGGITTEGETGDTTWVSKVTWYDTSSLELVGSASGHGVWEGTGSGDSVDDFLFDSTKAEFSDSTATDEYGDKVGSFYSSYKNTWSIYTGEQLLYALENYESGDTLEFKNDIDLNGQNYCWPDIELTADLTINGNGFTIYNLSAFITYDYDDCTVGIDSDGNTTYSYDTRSGFLSFVTGTYVINDLNFDTGKLYADTSGTVTEVSGTELGSVNLSLFGVEGSATVAFDGIQIDNYLVCSNSSAVSVFVSVGLAPDWDSTLSYTTGYEDGESSSYEDAASLEDYIQMDTYVFNVTANDCSVSNSYVYGVDHVGSMGSYTTMSFTNCYAVSNTLVGTGFHSGSFVSCLNNAGYFENCFAADNYLYSASQSGGFVGYSGDSADYVNCYASGVVEGYQYIGGFVGATRIGHDYASDFLVSRNYSTFTNCYSTTLVGMRTTTSNSGGFVGYVDYMEGYNPTEAAVFDSCYAAGEVGSTQTVTEDNTNLLGGFVGYDETYLADNTGEYETIYINCYYDKQTTAMREWVSGRYNSTDSTHTYEIDIMGVLTTDTDKFGTGLTSVPTATEHSDESDGTILEPEYGFIGFTNDDDWVYTTEEHYPELSVFANATSEDWTNPELVQAYSLASTATVLLDTWDYSYSWNEDSSLRSETKELNSGTYNTLYDYIADRYTYDTVREIVSNASLTSSAIFEEIGTDDGLVTQSYLYDEENEIEYADDKTIENKDDLEESAYNGLTAFDLDNEASTLTVTAPGIDWYEITESVNIVTETVTETGTETVIETVTGGRPIRLISFMKVDAGEDQVLTASDYYDHRDDAYFTMIDTIKENMIISLDYEDTWATSLTQIFPEDDASFYAVDTVDTNFAASETAQINTEVWRAMLVGEGFSMSEFALVDEDDGVYSYTENGKTTYFTIGQDGVMYYWANYTEGDNLDLLTSVELYMSTHEDNGDFDLYVALYSINVYGEDGDELSVTQQKWTGEIPMYPEISSDQYYIVRYYWVLGNGRYRSDYKIIEITSDAVDVSEAHNVTINVYNDSDGSPNSSVMAVNASGYGLDTTESPAIKLTFAEETSSSDTTATYSTGDDGSEIKNVAYGENSYVSWVQMDDTAIVTKTVLTMTSNNGYEVGTVEIEGPLEAGDEITIPIETFELEYTYDEDGTTITGQETVLTTTNVTYVVKADNARLYLEFADTVDDDGATTFDDTSYNITFDIYVQEATEISVVKYILDGSKSYTDLTSIESVTSSTLANLASDLGTVLEGTEIDNQSFVINLTGFVTYGATTEDTTDEESTTEDTTDESTSTEDFSAQVVLTNAETSKSIYSYLGVDDTITLYVDETIPMEFELYCIFYSINGGTLTQYSATEGITLEYGDTLEIGVYNFFTEESYFKARDEVNNEFTYNNPTGSD